ncbi:unnamed protein product [Dibothriocephalus latus]|uniref:ubiquitinyl hydrolase 1 n=1 Tax=Dibothriocephalus latus TaxID=60516 RepID=A0A3P7RL56_DIBLA|nr:unnamed protein product [Dibothriocephalus latus]
METLSAQNPWYCKQCEQHRQAYKKYDFWRLPEVLIIHLKRFRTTFPMQRINEFVDFPVEGLKILNSGHIYDLVAVSNHFGGLEGGHYTAYAKNQDDKRWYNFDDSYTRQLSKSRVVVRLLHFDACCSLE